MMRYQIKTKEPQTIGLRLCFDLRTHYIWMMENLYSLPQVAEANPPWMMDTVEKDLLYDEMPARLFARPDGKRFCL